MTRTSPRRYAATLLALVALTSCAAACGTSSPGPDGTSGAAASSAQRLSVTVTVTGKEVSPAPHVVDLAVGQTLTLTVISDHDDELHAHGFEVEEPLKAGVPLVVTLRGSQPGLYEVETHHPPLRLIQVAVR